MRLNEDALVLLATSRNYRTIAMRFSYFNINVLVLVLVSYFIQINQSIWDRVSWKFLGSLVFVRYETDIYLTENILPSFHLGQVIWNIFIV